MSCQPNTPAARSWLVCLLALACWAGAGPARAGPDVPAALFTDPQRRIKLAQALPRIEARMAERVKEMSLPGLSYAVLIDGDVVLARGLGLRDVAAGAAVDTDTVFRIASMSKSFTALAVLKLRDAGKLGLDDPVSRHVPELRGWRLPTRDSAPITLRHLLSHAAGLPEDNPYGDRQLALTPQQFTAWLKTGVPFASAPGQGFEYSNLGFMILGRVITNVSGKPYQSYIRDEILAPLGMTSTHWGPAAVPQGRLALGYRKQGDGWLLETMLADGEGGAMGGLMTTPRDLARFVAAFMSAYPPRDDAEQPPASRHSLREMQAGLGYPSLWQARSVPGGRSVGRGASYGFGLQANVDCNWGREVEHSGGLPGFGSDMRWLPDHGVGVIVLANLTYAGTGRLTREALLMLKDTGGLQPRETPASPALKQAARDLAALALDWSEPKAHALAAENLFLDEAADDRRQALGKILQDLGRCEPGELKAENALRGTLRLDCAQGWLDMTFTLAPTLPPRVQALDLNSARPLTPAMQQLASEVTAALSRGAHDLRLTAKAERATVAAVLEAARLTHGACKPGQVLGGDGDSQARLKLDCDRGALEMTLTAEQGRLARVALRPGAEAACIP